MSIDQDLMKLKRTIETLLPKRDKAIWEKEAAEKEAKEKYGCKTIKQLEQRVALEESQAQSLKEELEKGLKEAQERFKELLEIA